MKTLHYLYYQRLELGNKNALSKQISAQETHGTCVTCVCVCVCVISLPATTVDAKVLFLFPRNICLIGCYRIKDW